MMTSLRWIVFLSAFMLAACSKRLDGVYQDVMGVQKYEFTRDGKVYMSTIGFTSEGTYVIEDGKLKVTKSGGDVVVYEMTEDGAIKGPLGLELRSENAP